jgi:hypothetical protein
MHFVFPIALLQFVDDVAAAIDFDQPVALVHEHEVAVLRRSAPNDNPCGNATRCGPRDQRVALEALLGVEMQRSEASAPVAVILMACRSAGSHRLGR